MPWWGWGWEGTGSRAHQVGILAWGSHRQPAEPGRQAGSQLGGLMTSRPPSSLQSVPGLLAAHPGSGPVKDRPSTGPTQEAALHPGSASGDLSLDIWAPKAKGCVQPPQSSLLTPAPAEGILDSVV